MLLDEPFSALDTGLRDQLRSATAQILAEAGIATLLVTHDQQEAMSFADQLVVLRDGRLVQAGRPRDLYLAPADAATAAFLGPAIILDAEIRDGLAHCLLGAMPLAEHATPPRARARILLRPEQLHLSPQPQSEGDWHLMSVAFFGSLARICAQHQASSHMLTFDTVAGDIPPQGSAISIIVSGSAYAFP